MLVELRIRNVAVIDTVVLPLAAGLNVLTGETGAGKSLIIGALGMLLGERATSDRIRTGADRATVEGVFELPPSHPLFMLLDERGIDVGDEHTLVLKREVGANGRSRAWINGSPVTAGALSEIGSQLVSVHGQHESRALVDADHQRDLLDAYVQAGAVRRDVATAHEALMRLRVRQHELTTRHQQAIRRADYLRFLLQEISDVDPQPGEDESLDAEIRRLSHAEELQALTAQAAAAISGDERAALTRLTAVRRTLGSLTRIDPELERLSAGFEGAVDALEELARELETYAEGLEADPSRLRTLERRRDALLGVLRKHGPTLADVHRTADEAAQELALIDGHEAELSALHTELGNAELALNEAAHHLTAMRRAGAGTLATAVSALFPELGMIDGKMDVQCTPLDAIGPQGGESVQFAATLNAGMEVRPLGRIASGGELSRVMLALSTVLARLQQVPTLVFDEVDAGVGGAVAWQVGALMSRVAAHHQVLAISHLAQIAARAQHHVVVQKGAVGTVTTADTHVATGDARVMEIARMLGGDADREVSRAHARELLARGDQELQKTEEPTRKAGSKAPKTAASPNGAQRRGKPV
ncbi:MAG TPA: DNA repair protein RecN [Gemmatimonas aurantiaca]|uniref:DNA repair protein RecN n=2 Tax=Gemmatimonas aurantiaca TaxID=173480 RepID=C1A481_GEMAT|nr:DNA repair protein RecN [Gemmatimonas aurantiaca]BAH38906.1 DNA repair protein RecN [Gemmatimonas aurantiaca T-27]HCT57208.1 DNA repair protein RecN [Gemmatimonas aurantiaca]